MFLNVETWHWWAKGICSILLVPVVHFPLYLNMRQAHSIRCKHKISEDERCKKRAKIQKTSVETFTEKVYLSGRGEKAIIRYYPARKYKRDYLCSSDHTTVEITTEEIGRKPDALWKDEAIRENNMQEKA